MDTYYIAPENARAVLEERKQLRSAIESDWFRNGISFPFELTHNTSYGVLARQLASFRFEDALFIRYAERAGLTPAWLPFTADKFVVCSKLKMSYIHPRLTQRYNKHSELIVQKTRLVRTPVQCSGMLLRDICVDNGERLVDWHQNRLLQAYPEAYVFDEGVCNQDWLGRFPSRYDAFLSLFVSHMVLVEDYHGGESGDELDDFTSSRFEPAFARVTERYGYRPLIIRLPWWNELALYPDGQWLIDWQHCESVLKV